MCKESAETQLKGVDLELIIAIGGGGYIPARILRTFLKQQARDATGKELTRNIPIQAIGLTLYESAGLAGSDADVEVPGTKVTRTQWLDLSALGEMENLVGKRVLIVDEVDDTRRTLDYAVKELEKDVEAARQRMGGGDVPKTQFSIFVLHNKDKPKVGTLPDDMIANRYFSARTVGEEWINYPWEADDIEEHDRLALEHGSDIAR